MNRRAHVNRSFRFTAGEPAKLGTFLSPQRHPSMKQDHAAFSAADALSAPAGNTMFESVTAPLTHSPVFEADYPEYSLVHRVTDIVFALGLLLVFLPLILVVGLCLLGSGGPVFFAHARLGHKGRLFKVFKFRTMVPNADAVLAQILSADPDRSAEWQKEAKLKDDPRVTKIGRFLRKTSLDELPQLINILGGEMSLVGPRPIEPREISKYGRYARHYFAQRPGLTGLWQVSGRNDCSYQRRIALDAYYARNRSIALDMSIIIKTIRVVTTGRGAY